jgi:hypothetical protein
MGRLGSFTFEFLGVDVGFQQVSAKVLQGMRHVGTVAEEMSTKLRLGTASTADLFEQLAKGVPGIGEIVTFGRGIRELATGENAYVEVLKQQNAEQEKRIGLINKVADAIRAVNAQTRQREQGDADRLLSLHPSVTSSAANIFSGGEANAEDIRKNVREKFQTAFDEVAKQQREIADKMRHLVEDNETARKSGNLFPAAGFGVLSPEQVEKQVSEMRKQADALGKESARLREAAGGAENEALIKNGRAAFTQLATIVGKNVVGAYDAARASVERFLGFIPQTTAATSKLAASFDALAQSHAGNIKQFQTEQANLGIDLASGAIGKDLFSKLSDKSFFDQAARSVGSILQQYAPIVETITRLVDSNLGISGFAQRIGAQLGSLIPGRIDNNPQLFKSSTLGVTDLARRIQEGAASEHKETSSDKYLPTIDKSLKDAAAALNKLLGIKGGAVVGKP